MTFEFLSGFRRLGSGVSLGLICDKSTLQSLAKDELNALRKYRSLIVPPVLVMEKTFAYSRGRFFQPAQLFTRTSE